MGDGNRESMRWLRCAVDACGLFSNQQATILAMWKAKLILLVAAGLSLTLVVSAVAFLVDHLQTRLLEEEFTQPAMRLEQAANADQWDQIDTMLQGLSDLSSRIVVQPAPAQA